MAEKSFAGQLNHQFPIVAKQVEAGLYGMKRMASTLKQVCSYQKGCMDIATIFKQNEMKMDKSKETGLADLAMTYTMANASVLQSMGQIITDAHQKFLEKVMTTVSVPLRAFYDKNEVIRDHILKEEKKYEDNLKEHKDKIVKDKAKCLQLHADLVAKKKAVTAITDKNAKNYKETQKKYEHAKPIVQKAFADYEKLVLETEALQIKFYEEQRPRALEELEALERGRLQMVQDKLVVYTNLVEQLVAQLQEILTTVKLIAPQLSQQQAIDEFIDNVLSKFGEAPSEVAVAYDLPVSPEHIGMDCLVDDGNLPKVDKPSSTLLSPRSLKVARSASFRNANPEQVKQTLAAKYRPHGEDPTGKIVVVLYDYTPDPPDDPEYISLAVGEHVRVTAEDGEWWRGIKVGDSTNKEGSFPANYVGPLEGGDSNHGGGGGSGSVSGTGGGAAAGGAAAGGGAAAAGGGGGGGEGKSCRVMYDYTPEGPEASEYLTLKEGDLVIASQTEGEWWFGSSGGREGYFPSAYVQVE